MEAFEYSGIWFMPNDHDDVVAGRLIFSLERGLHLELEGYWGNFVDLHTYPRFSTIYGIADRKLLTLADARVIGWGFSTSAGPSATFRVATAVFDAHLDFGGDPQLTTTCIGVELSHLQEWAQITGVQIDWNPYSLSEHSRFGLRYEPPENIKVMTPDYELQLSSQISTQSRHLREYLWKQSLTFVARAKADLTINAWISEIVRPLCRFLDLATGQRNQVVEFYCYFPNEYPSDIPGMRRCAAVHSAMDNGLVPDRFLHESEMLFMLRDIKEELQVLLSKWLDSSQQYPRIMDLFFSAEFENRLPTGERFFAVIRALESYHREVLQRVDNDEVVHQIHAAELIDILSDRFPEDFQEWLSGMLKHGYEPSLRNRVKELLNTWSNVVRPIVGNSNAKDRFIDRVVATRNCFAHQGKESGARSFTGYNLYLATEVLSVVARMYLLKKMGMSEEKSDQLMTNSNRYNEIKRRVESLNNQWKE